MILLLFWGPRSWSQLGLEPRGTEEIRVRADGGEAEGGESRVVGYAGWCPRISWQHPSQTQGHSPKWLLKALLSYRICFPTMGFHTYHFTRSLLCLRHRWHLDGHSTLHFSIVFLDFAALGAVSFLVSRTSCCTVGLLFLWQPSFLSFASSSSVNFPNTGIPQGLILFPLSLGLLCILGLN